MRSEKIESTHRKSAKWVFRLHSLCLPPLKFRDPACFLVDIKQNQPKAPQHRAGGRLPWRINVRATLAGAHCSPLRTYKRKTCPVRLCGTESRRGLRTKLNKRTLPTNIVHPVRCVVVSRRRLLVALLPSVRLSGRAGMAEWHVSAYQSEMG